MFVFFVFVFVFGTIIGSFLNVIILRFNTGDSFLKGSSKCFSCSKKLSWYELVPIFSFLIQKGRCRQCGSKISWQYPLVEMISGFLFVLVMFGGGNILRIFYSWLLVSLLVIMAVYDLRHQIIPNVFVYIFDILAFLSLFVVSEFLSNFLSGVAFFSFFAFLWLISKGKWMGFGDAKLALGLGWLLGPSLTISAFLFSFWLGSLVSVGLLLFSRSKITIKSRVPFAPFLVLGSLISFLVRLDIIKIFYG